MSVTFPSAPIAQTKTKRNDLRIHEIDGIRGWASLSVVVFHFVAETFGHVHIGFLSGYFKLFLDGPLAVYVFFILSGDSLATAVFSQPDLRSWRHIVAKRYMRLSLPILLTTLLTLGVMRLGLVFNSSAAQLVHREDWLGTFLNFDASFASALKYTFAGVYGWVGTPNYNTFLWSIAVEWTGSVLVLLSVPVLKHLRYAEMFTAVIAIYAFWLTDYLGMFVIGVLFSLMRRRGIFERARALNAGQICSAVLIILVYFVDLRRQSYPMPPHKTLLNMCEIFWRSNFFNLSAPILVASLYINNITCKFMRSRASQFLGYTSYSLYLVQFVVLCSFLSYLVVCFPDAVHDASLALTLSGVAILLCLTLAWALSKVEVKMLRVVGRFANAVLVP